MAVHTHVLVTLCKVFTSRYCSKDMFSIIKLRILISSQFQKRSLCNIYRTSCSSKVSSYNR